MESFPNFCESAIRIRAYEDCFEVLRNDRLYSSVIDRISFGSYVMIQTSYLSDLFKQAARKRNMKYELINVANKRRCKHIWYKFLEQDKGVFYQVPNDLLKLIILYL